jgi:hypothetical protein
MGNNDNGLLFTKCGNITMTAFGIGGNGSKLCVAQVTFYYSLMLNYGKKLKKKIHLKIKKFLPTLFITFWQIFATKKHWSQITIFFNFVIFLHW